jgi:hypothetical protein
VDRRTRTEERIRREIEAFRAGLRRVAHLREFRAAGGRGLWQAILRSGGRAVAA